MEPILETHQTTHAVHQGTITPPPPLSTNTNHTQNPSAQKSFTHQIHVIQPTKSSSTTIWPLETQLNNLRWMVLISSIWDLKGDFQSWITGSDSVGNDATDGLSLVSVVAGLTSLAGERVWERERRTEKKREIGSGEREWAFCKMFYHWFFGKIFYKFLCTNFGQIENILQLWLYFTCKQTLENRKIFYRKYFTSKQTERKTIQLNEPLGFS